MKTSSRTSSAGMRRSFPGMIMSFAGTNTHFGTLVACQTMPNVQSGRHGFRNEPREAWKPREKRRFSSGVDAMVSNATLRCAGWRSHGATRSVVEAELDGMTASSAGMGEELRYTSRLPCMQSWLILHWFRNKWARERREKRRLERCGCGSHKHVMATQEQ